MRALARLALQRGGPRDLAGIAAGLGVAREIEAFLTRTEATFPPPEHVTRELAALAAADAALEARLRESLVPEPPADRRAGGFIAQGVDAELDELRSLRDESRRVIAGVQARYVERPASGSSRSSTIISSASSSKFRRRRANAC